MLIVHFWQHSAGSSCLRFSREWTKVLHQLGKIAQIYLPYLPLFATLLTMLCYCHPFYAIPPCQFLTVLNGNASATGSVHEIITSYFPIPVPMSVPMLPWLKVRYMPIPPWLKVCHPGSSSQHIVRCITLATTMPPWPAYASLSCMLPWLKACHNT